MKKYLFTYLLPALLLGLSSVSFVACGDDDEEESFVEDAVVKVDSKGNAKGDHTFVQIDDNNFYIDGFKYTVVNSGELEVSGYDGYAKLVGKKSIIKGLEFGERHFVVTSIGQNALMYCDISGLFIPSTVTRIGKGAFSNCTALTTINIPEGITVISDETFKSCPKLTSIKIPNKVTSIGNGAFYYCPLLTSITIPDNVTSIGEYAFCDCVCLNSINIPSGVTSISEYTFKGCLSLTSITIPEGVTFRILHGSGLCHHQQKRFCHPFFHVL